jgi:hypothetical protein
MMIAYVLWHVRKDDEYGDDAKLIGVYSSRENGEAAIGRLSDKPGFRDHSAGFHVDEYTVDKDHWVDGFISWDEAVAPD